VIWVVVAAVVVLAVDLAAAGLVVALKWPGMMRFWDHRTNEQALIGTWGGSLSTGHMSLVLNEDHTFSQYIDGFSDLEPKALSGTWTYSKGELTLHGLTVVYTRPFGHEYYTWDSTALKVYGLTITDGDDWIRLDKE
jgi:hypothetical protein